MAAIDRELALLDRPRVETMFVGGGTPTQLSPRQLETLLAGLQRRFELAADYEWTVEANPEDIDDQMLDVLIDHGVNRISLGVQSFDQEKLRTLERSHTGSLARDVIQRVAQRIKNVSIDLIFAAPHESLETWQCDVATALALPITHLSSYALTFEKGTMFWNRQRRGELPTTDESLEVEMYGHIRSVCSCQRLRPLRDLQFCAFRTRGADITLPTGRDVAGSPQDRAPHASLTDAARSITAAPPPICIAWKLTKARSLKRRSSASFNMPENEPLLESACLLELICKHSVAKRESIYRISAGLKSSSASPPGC